MDARECECKCHEFVPQQITWFQAAAALVVVLAALAVVGWVLNDIFTV